VVHPLESGSPLSLWNFIPLPKKMKGKGENTSKVLIDFYLQSKLSVL
jgi:hypothetical protein